MPSTSTSSTATRPPPPQLQPPPPQPPPPHSHAPPPPQPQPQLTAPPQPPPPHSDSTSSTAPPPPPPLQPPPPHRESSTSSTAAATAPPPPPQPQPQPQEIENMRAAYLSNQMASIWYGIILAAVLSIVQLIYGGKPQTTLSTVSLFASLSLIGLTSFNCLPCPKQFKISFFFAILACDAFLSATVLHKLWLLPYLSCIRPLFDLLGDLYFLCREFVIGHLLAASEN
ncbi:hypothetical protein AAC387_Pa09g1299 [Persea americana]